MNCLNKKVNVTSTSLQRHNNVTSYFNLNMKLNNVNVTTNNYKCLSERKTKICDTDKKSSLDSCLRKLCDTDVTLTCRCCDTDTEVLVKEVA